MDFPIFIISLEDAEDRRRALVEQLDQIGLTYTIHTGVDARTGVPAEYEHLIDRAWAERLMGRPMANPEFGCALSHRAVYERILREGHEGAVILEDDAVVDARLAEFLRLGGHRKAEMVLLDYSRLPVFPFLRQQVSHDLVLRRVARRTGRATAYTVSRWAAGELLKATTPVRYQADWPHDLYKVKAWATVPRVVDHPPPRNPESHIAEERYQLQQIARRGKSLARFLKGEYWRNRIAVRIDP